MLDGWTGHIAAWCRKGDNKHLYAIDGDDSENVEEAADNEGDMQAWCLLEVRENEQWQEGDQQTRQSVEKTTIAMDYYFMKMKSVVNAQAVSEESVICIAVKVDRHQNIMSSVASRKGDEIPWTMREWRKSLTCLVIVRSH